MTKIYNIENLQEQEIMQIAEDLRNGKVAVFATDTIYGIGSNAFDFTAEAKIFQIKNRPQDMPLPILVSSLDESRKYAQVDDIFTKLAENFWPGSLTIIAKPTETSTHLGFKFSKIALRISGSAFLTTLVSKMQIPLSATSANLHGQAPSNNSSEIVSSFKDKVDYILLGNQDISGEHSTIVDITSGEVEILRQGDITKEQIEKVFE